MSRTAEHGRGRVVRLLALLLCAAGLSGVTPTSAAGAEPRAERWSGYAIRATGNAAGGWIGGYRVGRTTVFMTTPSRDPNRTGFRTPRTVADVPGHRASRAETARAAWILSKYGDYRDATQAAAVDAAVYHLLVGGRWRVGSPRGARRIRQSGDRASVARFASIMLRLSRRSAGAYTARLTTSGADLGGSVTVTVMVLDGHGRPASGLPATLTMPGAEPVASVTGDDGRAVARFAASTPGWQDVTATVGQVPEHRLHTWTAQRSTQASAAEGGARRTLVVTERTPVRGPQTLSLKASPEVLVVGGLARVVATVAGDGAARAAGAALFGPFATAGAAQCAGSSLASAPAQVSADGGYPMPAVTPVAGGYYAWKVAVDGTDTSLPVTACGAVVKVRGRTSVTVSAPPTALAGNSQVTARVSGVPFPTRVDLVVKLYNSPGCTSAIAQYPLSRLGNGDVTSGPIWLDPGSYYWQVEALPGELWEGSLSACGVAGSTTVVN
ncbi:Ig-like domain-containing protein [Nocardioides sp.]|uniref:Ig-like domain-containing protein n=1 Tax=Nocardioides sp. TaxID=35761 RepID=UPI0026106CE3|nr:Ig-like domain-containing protein [Nocardioides sp.]MCW2738444.1 hypothetical protein [Nocardioides sp.]